MNAPPHTHTKTDTHTHSITANLGLSAIQL